MQEDARTVRSKEAILDAARELLVAYGPSAITHQRIAAHASVGRATVYRHWPRAQDLLLEAMAGVPMPFFMEPRSPFREWLVEGMTAIARQFDERVVLAVTTTLFSSALWNADADAKREGFARVLGHRLEVALVEAQRRHEVVLTCDPRAGAALILGPLTYRAVVEHLSTDAAFIDEIVDRLGEWSAPSLPAPAERDGPRE